MTAPLPGRAAPRLNIGDALHDGWQAFCRSPGAFVLFGVLLWGLQIVFQLLQARVSGEGSLSPSPSDWVLALVGLVGAIASYCWGRIGIVRGAFRSLDGHRPSFVELIRWETGPIGRLCWASLLMGGLLGGLLLVLLLGVACPLFVVVYLVQGSGPGVAPIQDLVMIGLLVLVLGIWLVALIYLIVNQQFQAQISLTERLGPWATLGRSRALADPHWPLLLLLLIIESLLCLVGIFACVVGFFIAWPVVLCVTTAAYRQLLALETTNPLPPAS
jgi:hypothetical protein